MPRRLEAGTGRVAVRSNGEVWVTDRLLQRVFIFNADGTYLRTFEPSGDTAKTWAPIAIAFDSADNVYIADVGILKQHQIIEFSTDGTEIRRWGTTVQTKRMEDSPGGFYYPNGIAIAKNGDIFVSDSNNRRVQVFSKDAEFKYVIPTSGTPRGMVIDSQQRLYVVDAFAHTVTSMNSTARDRRLWRQCVALESFPVPQRSRSRQARRIFRVRSREQPVQVWG